MHRYRMQAEGGLAGLPWSSRGSAATGKRGVRNDITRRTGSFMECAAFSDGSHHVSKDTRGIMGPGVDVRVRHPNSRHNWVGCNRKRHREPQSRCHCASWKGPSEQRKRRRLDGFLSFISEYSNDKLPGIACEFDLGISAKLYWQ